MTQSKTKIEQMRKGLLNAISAKDKLNSLDDSISATIKSIEDALTKLNLGFRISAKQEIENGTEYLEFQKWGSEWRMTYGTAHALIPEYPVKALLDCDRDTRARALRDLLPELVLNVGKSLQDRITEREEAIKTGIELEAVITNVQYDDIPF